LSHSLLSLCIVVSTVKNEPCDNDDEEEDDGIDNFVTPVERPPKKTKINSEAALHAGSEILVNDENVMHLPFVRCVMRIPSTNKSIFCM